jgi:hypothetical protein
VAARTGATSSRQKSTNVKQERTFGRFIRAPPERGIGKTQPEGI